MAPLSQINRITAAGVVLAVWLAPSFAAAQGTVLFRSDFNTPGPGPDPKYGFEWSRPANGPCRYNGIDHNPTCPVLTHTKTHLPTGDADGSGAVQIVWRANVGQAYIGFVTPGIGGSWPSGSSMFLRFRIKLGPGTHAVGPTGENKFLVVGTGGGSPESRTLLLMHNPTDGNYCTLGWADYGNIYGAGANTIWFRPSAYGLPGTNWTSAFVGLKPHLGIGGFCTPPVAMTHAAPFAVMPNSAPPVNGWYSYQLQIQSGPAGTAAYRVWINNNDQSRPTYTTAAPVPQQAMGTNGWSGQIELGGYATHAHATDQTYLLGHFEVSTAFDPGFFSTGSATVPAVPALPRIVGPSDAPPPQD